MTAHVKYPILWIRAKDFFANQNARLWLGLCGYSKRVCKITSGVDMMTLLVVRDLYVTDETKCEEAQRCLDSECPLNATTWKSYCRSLDAQRRPSKPPSGFGTTPAIWNRGDDVRQMYRELLEKHSTGGLVMRERKGGSR